MSSMLTSLSSAAASSGWRWTSTHSCAVSGPGLDTIDAGIWSRPTPQTSEANLTLWVWASLSSSSREIISATCTTRRRGSRW